MKKILMLILLSINFSFAQTNYYTFNDGEIFNDRTLETKHQEIIKNIREPYKSVKPLIYHKIIKVDSIINYIAFRASKKKEIVNYEKIEFKQDSLFLLLNKRLPEFELKDLEGVLFNSSKLMGKPALINYWAIYCKPCIEEMPQLNKLKKKYDSKMNFIALAENTCEKDNLKGFIETHPFDFYNLENAYEYKKTLKIGAIPVNLFIDKKGYIRYIQGNYPIESYNKETNEYIYSENNFFTKIIEKLLSE